MVFYRPVGLEELLLVFASGMKAFPPRLPEQPIFYPVLHESYAAYIAREWNTKSHSLAGYVTQFSLSDAYASQYAVHTVGARVHQELWVPAEQLEELNAKIEGQILVTGAFFGDGFRGVIPGAFSLKGKDATQQLVSLSGIHDYNLFDFQCEIAANKEAVFAHFPLWKQRSFEGEGVPDAQRAVVLDAIRTAWSRSSPTIPLTDV